MSDPVDDTIVAIASAPGGSPRGVVRISGPATCDCLLRCFRPSTALDLRGLRRARVVPGTLALMGHGRSLPVDLYYWPTARSYTRQVAAELHTIGSPPLLDAAVETLCRCGTRLATPGEFTLRAYLTGRIDLTQAEAVLGVIEARDERSLEVALQQLAGGLANPVTQLRSSLLDLLADLEASLDFGDEDLEGLSLRDVGQRLSRSHGELEHLLARLASRGVSRREPRVVLRGRPNVGKSSLVNALAKGHVAIVSERAGTTRDYVTRRFSWDGRGGLLVDTAGVDDLTPPSGLARAAQDAAAAQHRRADLEIFCLDASHPVRAWEREVLTAGSRVGRLVVWTKIDAATNPEIDKLGDVRTSSRTGEGLDQLRALISARLGGAEASTPPVVASTAQRCRRSLEATARHLHAARQLSSRDNQQELVAWELREALQELGHVAGAVYTDDLLDRVFSRFCIGK